MERLIDLELSATASLRAASPGTLERPELVDQPQEQGEWMVVVFDNDTNTYEEVISILMVATGCNEEEAYIEAWEIDHYGQCCVHIASEDECHDVAKIIRKIGIAVEVKSETC